jgi:uncharacterized protein (DUF924 family)
MVGGILSKEDYKTLKGKYAADAEALIAANERLRREIDDALSCKHERMAWIGHFKQFEDLAAIDRKAVAVLIKSIRIIGRREITIDYNYQDEYAAASDIGGMEGDE